MGAAIDDVHHGNGEHVRVATADIFVEGESEVVSRSLCDCEGYTEDGVGAKVGLGVGAVEGDHCLVDTDLIESGHTYKGMCDRTVYILHSLEHTLTHITSGVVVTEFKSLVDTCGCTGGNCGTAKRTALEIYVDFYCRIAAGIKHLTADDFLNLHLYFVCGYSFYLFRFTEQRFAALQKDRFASPGNSLFLFRLQRY